MCNAKRDSKGGVAAHAIPSMGEIEGKLTVLEVVAATTLRMLLQQGDKHAAQHVLSEVKRAMRSKCDDIRLSPSDSKSAIEYAQELIDAIYEDAEFRTPTIEDEMLIA